MNRKEYNTLVNYDTYVPAQRLVLPNVTSADTTYGEAYPYEPFPLENDNDKAKEYLDKAVSELGVSSPADIEVTLLTTDTEGAKKQAEVLKEQYEKNLGIKVEIDQVTYKERLEREQVLDYDMVPDGYRIILTHIPTLNCGSATDSITTPDITIRSMTSTLRSLRLRQTRRQDRICCLRQRRLSWKRTLL